MDTAKLILQLSQINLHLAVIILQLIIGFMIRDKSCQTEFQVGMNSVLVNQNS